MKIVADERIAALDPTFARHGELITMPGRLITAKALEDADALITRTVTTVDEDLLQGTAVRFVGTATIGTDHLDTSYLDAQGIAWAAAPGCNADATAQYTLAIYLLACQRLGRDPSQQHFGIVGCGNVGGRLKQLLESLAVDVIACDPPLEAAGASEFRPMSEILACDAISLHVPLTSSGQWPTHRMFDTGLFSKLPASALLINASRGDVIEANALSGWIDSGGRVALDVWPGEPDIDPALIKRTTVASPHVAGYSLDGKIRATSMVYRAFCEHFGFSEFVEPTLPPGPLLNVDSLTDCSLESIVLSTCPIERDDRAIRDRLGFDAEDRTGVFDALRSHYPERRDFAAWTLDGSLNAELAETLKNIGFSVPNH